MSACRTCGSHRMARHCPRPDSPTCDLFKCLVCKSFGNPHRWHADPERRPHAQP